MKQRSKPIHLIITTNDENMAKDLYPFVGQDSKKEIYIDLETPTTSSKSTHRDKFIYNSLSNEGGNQNTSGPTGGEPSELIMFLGQLGADLLITWIINNTLDDLNDHVWKNFKGGLLKIIKAVKKSSSALSKPNQKIGISFRYPHYTQLIYLQLDSVYNIKSIEKHLNTFHEIIKEKLPITPKPEGLNFVVSENRLVMTEPNQLSSIEEYPKSPSQNQIQAVIDLLSTFGFSDEKQMQIRKILEE